MESEGIPIPQYERLALDCDGPAFVDHHQIRTAWKRYGVDMLDG